MEFSQGFLPAASHQPHQRPAPFVLPSTWLSGSLLLLQLGPHRVWNHLLWGAKFPKPTSCQEGSSYSMCFLLLPLHCAQKASSNFFSSETAFQRFYLKPDCFLFYFIFKLYIIVLVLPNIKMNPPQVYMCSLSWTLLPPPSPFHPSGSSQCTSPKHPVSCIELGLATRFIHDILHVSI